MARSSSAWWRRVWHRPFFSVSEALKRGGRRRRPARAQLRLEPLEERVVPAAWSSYGGNAQHTGIASAASQPLEAIHWQTPVDLDPQFSGEDLFIHYASPVVTAGNTVIVAVKTGADGNFQVKAFNGATGTLKWTVTTDDVLAPHSWTPSFSMALASDGRLYFAGLGDRSITSTIPTPTRPITGQVAFYGNANHTSAEDATVHQHAAHDRRQRQRLFRLQVITRSRRPGERHRPRGDRRRGRGRRHTAAGTPASPMW